MGNLTLMAFLAACGSADVEEPDYTLSVNVSDTTGIFDPNLGETGEEVVVKAKPSTPVEEREAEIRKITEEAANSTGIVDYNAPCVQVEVQTVSGGPDNLLLRISDPKGGCVSLTEDTPGSRIANDSGIASTAIFVNNDRRNFVTYKEGTQEVRERFTISDLARGLNTISILSCDNADPRNCGEDLVDVYVFGDSIRLAEKIDNDYTRPTISGVETAKVAQGDHVFIDGVIEDPESGIASIKVYSEGRELGFNSESLVRELVSSDYESKVRFSDIFRNVQMPNRVTTYTIVAENNAGLHSEAEFTLKAEKGFNKRH
tara:strand:+ start:3742 stop:4689 length:948 start_codon:yes stop_codon:yes gene_type:complete